MRRLEDARKASEKSLTLELSSCIARSELGSIAEALKHRGAGGGGGARSLHRYLRRRS
jgi:hypothetical protein